MLSRGGSTVRHPTRTSMPSGTSDQASERVTAFIADAVGAPPPGLGVFMGVDVASVQAGRRILDDGPEMQARVVLEVITRLSSNLLSPLELLVGLFGRTSSLVSEPAGRQAEGIQAIHERGLL